MKIPSAPPPATGEIFLILTYDNFKGYEDHKILHKAHSREEGEMMLAEFRSADVLGQLYEMLSKDEYLTKYGGTSFNKLNR
jgi:hypothetical protein